MAKTEEEKAIAAAEKAAKARLAEEAQQKAEADAEAAKIKAEQEADLNGPELTEEELKAQSDAAQAAFAAAQAKKKDAEGIAPQGERMYSKAEMQAMIKAVMDGKDLDAEEEEEVAKKKTLRLSRFQNKFITSLKNMNTDEYYPDGQVYAYDVYDERSRSNIAWVTLVFQDGTDLAVPLETALRRSNKVNCEIVKIDEKDKSYDFGKVEKTEVKDYNVESTGEMIKAKVTQKEYTYQVKLPSGDVITVGREVINW
jgi:hypothetical protein